MFSFTDIIRKNLHEQKDGQLVEQYLWVGEGPPIQNIQKCSKIVEMATDKYLTAEERRSSDERRTAVFSGPQSEIQQAEGTAGRRDKRGVAFRVHLVLRLCHATCNSISPTQRFRFPIRHHVDIIAIRSADTTKWCAQTHARDLRAIEQTSCARSMTSSRDTRVCARCQHLQER